MSDEVMQRSSSRKLTWYAFAALTFVVIVTLNRERRVSRSYVELKEPTADDATFSRLSPRNHHKPIRQISILGERNSGTRWTYRHLNDCFNHTLPVVRDLTRYKHWFQYRNASKYKHDTLVIAQFRNPYEWLEAMRNVPHHAPAHMFMQWSEFLTKPWTTERIGLDLTTPKNATCHDDFKYHQVVSCSHEPLPHEAYDHKLRFSENQPFYELKKDGEPFKNVMEMRSAKIRNFLEVKDYQGVADVWVVQYEYLLQKGTKSFIDAVSEFTSIPAKCDPFPVQDRKKRDLSQRFVQYLNEKLDWTAEGLIGYTQRLPLTVSE